MIVKTDCDAIRPYTEDPSNVKGGGADRVYIPETEDDVRAALAECAAAGTPLTVSGGGTGTVGGRVPRGGAILSMERFSAIDGIDAGGLRARLGAGVVIKDFLAELDPRGLFYPPFPTERSAFIGGNVSSNASGEYSYRFGATRRHVRGIRVLLTGGGTLDLERGASVEKDGVLRFGPFRLPLPSYRTPDIKCAAGYYCRPGMDAIDLFIGSEGTLGIVTRVDVSLIPRLPERFILVLFLPGDGRILDLIATVKARPDLDVYSLEYFDPGSLVFLKDDFPGIPEGAFALYIEAAADPAAMEAWGALAEEFGALDAWTGADPKNYERLIDFRHRLPENVNAYFRKLGISKVAIDAAVPEARFPEFYRAYREIMIREKIRTILFGHIGENHVHFNFFPKDEAERTRAMELYRESALRAVSFGGTVAAEHGIGKLKHTWLELMYGADGVRQMAAVKKALDPACILGLDNIFPRALLADVPPAA